MSNPARELHQLFIEWQTRHKGQRIAPMTGRGETPDEIATGSLKAMDAVVQIDHLLAEWGKSRNVATYRRYLVRWINMITVYPNAWQSPANADSIYPQSAIDQLEALADLVDMSNEGWVPALAEERIREFMDAVRDALESDEELPAEFRSYIEELIAAIEDALKHGDIARLKADLEHLRMALFVAESQSPKQKGKWLGLLGRWGMGTISQTIASLPGTAIEIAATSGA